MIRLLLLILTCCGALPAAELYGAFGAYKRYLDEPAEPTYGVAVRIPVTRRLAIRPEFLADSGSRYSNQLLLGSITGDFTNPDKPAVGYWVGSAGLVRTEEVPFSFTASQATLMGGVGVRFRLSEHWAAAAEFRAGFPVFPLVTFSFGYRWGGSRLKVP